MIRVYLRRYAREREEEYHGEAEHSHLEKQLGNIFEVDRIYKVGNESGHGPENRGQRHHSVAAVDVRTLEGGYGNKHKVDNADKSEQYFKAHGEHT